MGSLRVVVRACHVWIGCAIDAVWAGYRRYRYRYGRAKVQVGCVVFSCSYSKFMGVDIYAVKHLNGTMV